MQGEGGVDKRHWWCASTFGSIDQLMACNWWPCRVLALEIESKYGHSLTFERLISHHISREIKIPTFYAPHSLQSLSLHCSGRCKYNDACFFIDFRHCNTNEDPVIYHIHYIDFIFSYKIKPHQRPAYTHHQAHRQPRQLHWSQVSSKLPISPPIIRVLPFLQQQAHLRHHLQSQRRNQQAHSENWARENLAGLPLGLLQRLFLS